MLRVAKKERIRQSHSIVLAFILMATLTGASFIYALAAMATNPDAAYFITPTRLWELGVGSLLALSAPWLQGLNLAASRAISVAGLIAILAAGTLFDSTTPFPGATALLPVLGAAGVIAGGISSVGSVAPIRLLANPPMVWVGRISYALYLWHWPLLAIAAQGFGLAGVWAGIALVGVAFLPAYLSTRLLEEPIAHNKKWRSRPTVALRVGAIAAVCSLLSASALMLAAHQDSKVPEGFDIRSAGAATLTVGDIPPQVTSIPKDLGRVC